MIPILELTVHWRPHYGEDFKRLLTKMLDEKYKGAEPTGVMRNPYTFAVDAFHLTTGCCGVNNGSDFNVFTDGLWRDNKLAQLGLVLPFPPSCCKMNVNGKGFSIQIKVRAPDDIC